jgi:hypothetical protein
MPAQHIANQIGIPDFKQVVIYTGNVMRSVAGRDKPWNKKTNTEVMMGFSFTVV